jgi:signal transduction histidine kinase
MPPERRRIGYVTQEAVGAERVRPGADAPWDLVGRAQGLVAHDVRRLRALLDELVPPASTAEEPEAALTELADQVRRSSGGAGPVVEIDVAQDHGLSDDGPVLVHRVAGELLRNAFRHACAGSVRVVLARGAGDSAALTVTDDGVGFEPSSSRRPGHVGLQLVQQVVEDSGGRMFVDLPPRRGDDRPGRDPAAAPGLARGARRRRSDLIDAGPELPTPGPFSPSDQKGGGSRSGLSGGGGSGR